MCVFNHDIITNSCLDHQLAAGIAWRESKRKKRKRTVSFNLCNEHENVTAVMDACHKLFNYSACGTREVASRIGWSRRGIGDPFHTASFLLWSRTKWFSGKSSGSLHKSLVGQQLIQVSNVSLSFSFYRRVSYCVQIHNCWISHSNQSIPVHLPSRSQFEYYFLSN